MKLIARVFTLLVFFSLANSLTPIASVPQEHLDFVKEAKQLYALEENYYQARIRSDWQAIYNYQHPDYRKIISMEEFMYYDGRTLHDYFKSHSMSISGNENSVRDYIKKNNMKKDTLGFPIQRKYQFFSDPHHTVKQFTVDKISISKDGKYAKTHYKADVDSMLPSAIVRDFIRIKRVISGEDFWEKVNEDWFITVLKNAVSISGIISELPYFIPNSNEAWEKMEFVDVDPDSILPKASPETTQKKDQN